MSSHFKYEIDERNLRLQLKENELSFSEDAWQKFEVFTAAHKISANEDIIKRINIPLNRNIILPAVFGAVIILFSLLLFNFINIKNPNTASNESNNQPEAITETTESKTPVTPPQKEAAAPVITKDSVTAEAPANITEPEVEKPAVVKETEQRKVEEPVVADTPKRKKRDEESSAGSTLGSDSNTTPNIIVPEVSIKKKRRKREMIVTEPTQEEADQLPPPASTSVETPQ